MRGTRLSQRIKNRWPSLRFGQAFARADTYMTRGQCGSLILTVPFLYPLLLASHLAHPKSLQSLFRCAAAVVAGLFLGRFALRQDKVLLRSQMASFHGMASALRCLGTL